MKHLIVLLLLVAGTLGAQTDSTSKITHEAGFNTVLLIRQVINNNPAAMLSQSPYLLMYNIGIYKICTGRVGLGVAQASDKTTITGQPKPRTTDQLSLSGRLGAGKDLFESRRVVANVFVDGVYGMFDSRTVTTSTFSSGFPSGTNTITTTTSLKSQTIGGQIGMGVKFQFTKHVSVYAECPLQFALIDTKELDESISTGGGILSQINHNDTKSTRTSIFLPTTLYLLIKF
jgi:hypothetical protein